MQGNGQLSNYAYDTFVAQGFSKLTQYTTTAVGPDHTQHRSWLTSFTLNSIFTMNAPSAKRALAFSLLRRAEGAVDDFDAACVELAEFVTTNRTVSGYFRALRRLESSIAQVHQGLDFLRNASGKDFFKKNDGTYYQRLNEVYNVSRHGDPQALPEGDLQLLWLENDGIHVASAVLAFDELRELVAELARAADYVSSGAPFR